MEGRASAQAAWLLQVLTSDYDPAPDDLAERLSSELLATRSAEAWREALLTVGRSLHRAHVFRTEVEHDYLVRVVLSTLDGPFVRLSCRVELATGRISSFGLSRPFREIAWTDQLVPVAGGELRVRDYGGTGQAAVLLHCGLADVSHWDRPARDLGGRRVAIDLRAHGHWPASVGFRISQIAGDIAATIDQLDLAAATLIGHSLGGWVAVACAARFRVGSRLVTLDGPFALDRGVSGTPSPPDAPEWRAVLDAPEPIDAPDDVDNVAIPWLALLCETRDQWTTERPAFAERVARRPHRRVVWEPTKHEDIVNNARALYAARTFASGDA